MSVALQDSVVVQDSQDHKVCLVNLVHEVNLEGQELVESLVLMAEVVSVENEDQQVVQVLLEEQVKQVNVEKLEKLEDQGK